MNHSEDKFEHSLSDIVEMEERSDWFERNLHRRRITPREAAAPEHLAVYRIANAVLILLIALGLYLLGQFDGTNAERKRLAQPAAFDDLIIRSQKKEGMP
jgi:hypothetical protein